MTKEVMIQNEYVCARISSQAAEVISFMSKKSKVEMIWCRDPKFWYNCNPILFPITGKLVNNAYTYQGKTYELTGHGFPRDSEFEFEEVKNDSCVLSLSASDKTRCVYPFEFKVTVKYHLEGYALKLSYCIENNGDVEMPFQVGFHPAFNCPMAKDDKFEDYVLKFEKEEDLDAKGFVFGHTNTMSCKQSFDGERSIFYYDGHIQSDYVQLTNGRYGIEVGLKGYDTLGLWRRNDETPFLCIEPWHPHNDLKKNHFFRKDALNDVLDPKQQYCFDYYFKILE